MQNLILLLLVIDLLSQEYCLLLTIRDPNGKVPVYDEVAQQLDYKNFIHHDINIRNVVTIENNDN